MVFQNYALYPHLSVRANLGFGLKLRKTSKPTSRRRVDEVARILGLEEMLERKPGELSGGQRQRVAMGRAIVREPQAFLMDEPLSNLDAKLRVSMRAQLSRLHERLGVTTVYVTHDQVEAMTLGQRVAVLRGGVLQQCDTPEMLFEHPANLFVAAFIGSPAMNLVEADGRGRRGALRLLPACRWRRLAAARPDRARHPPARPQARRPGVSRPRQVVERLGTETHVVVGHRRAAAARPRADRRDRRRAATTTSCWPRTTAPRSRSSPRPAPPVAVGDTVELTVDAARLHGFDIETGEALGNEPMPAQTPVAA